MISFGATSSRSRTAPVLRHSPLLEGREPRIALAPRCLCTRGQSGAPNPVRAANVPAWRPLNDLIGALLVRASPPTGTDRTRGTCLAGKDERLARPDHLAPG